MKWLLPILVSVPVIRDWSDTLREDAIAFNEALPCGAELIDTESEGRLTIATFELTERPGPA